MLDILYDSSNREFHHVVENVSCHIVSCLIEDGGGKTSLYQIFNVKSQISILRILVPCGMHIQTEEDQYLYSNFELSHYPQNLQITLSSIL